MSIIYRMADLTPQEMKEMLDGKKKELYKSILSDWEFIELHFKYGDELQQKEETENYAARIFRRGGSILDARYEDLGISNIVKDMEDFIISRREFEQQTKQLWDEVYALELKYKEMTT